MWLRVRDLWDRVCHWTRILLATSSSNVLKSRYVQFVCALVGPEHPIRRRLTKACQHLLKQFLASHDHHLPGKVRNQFVPYMALHTYVRQDLRERDIYRYGADPLPCKVTPSRLPPSPNASAHSRSGSGYDHLWCLGDREATSTRSTAVHGVGEARTIGSKSSPHHRDAPLTSRSRPLELDIRTAGKLYWKFPLRTSSVDVARAGCAM